MSGMIVTPKSWQDTGWVLLDPSVDPYGIVGVGGPLTVERLKLGYSLGIFPWPQDGELFWFCPPRRGVLDFNELHIPSRFEREWKQAKYDYTIDQSFDEVVEHCAIAKRKNQTGTWITQEIMDAYKKLHRNGCAHSFEVWENGILIGGLYGVQSDRVFAGESAFGLKSNVSKHAVLWCLQNQIQAGRSWMDIQMVTPLTEQFGGKYIPREEFIDRL